MTIEHYLIGYFAALAICGWAAASRALYPDEATLQSIAIGAIVTLLAPIVIPAAFLLAKKEGQK